MGSFIGIDTTNFYKEGRKAFRAPLGVAVEVENFDSFDEKYQQILTELCSELGITTIRKCVKSHYIYQKNPDKAVKFVIEFSKRIIPYIKNIYVMHSILSQSKTPEIFCFNGTKTLSVNEFIPILQSSYNHVIAWKLLNDFSNTKQSEIFLDHFTGSITKAWEEIENNNLFILSAGEYCNPLISTADIISKYISDFIHINIKKLDYDGISSAFTNFEIVEISDTMGTLEIEEALKTDSTKLYQRFVYDLNMITPSSRRTMNVDRKLKHPIYFILTSKKLIKEKDAMESTPLYDLITNMAYASKGCVHGLNVDDLTKEVQYMQNGDEIIAIGEDALSNAKYLVEDLTGLSIKVTSSKEILKNL